jgi:S1-C subfamily serine protease
MRRDYLRLAIFCFLFVGLLLSPSSGNAQNFPTFENLRERNVALKMSSYIFTSGVNERGELTTCEGTEWKEAGFWGSGFIVKEDGTIVTNFHVADKALEGAAIFDDGSTFRITQIKVYDPITDLAVLKIQANKKFPTVTIGNSDSVHPMDQVLAVGNPRGAGINVTDGRISQLVRDDNNKIVRLRHTAPIAGGNSGGALYKGEEVVGVNVATWPGTQFHQAVPINDVLPLLTVDRNLPLKNVFHPDVIKEKAKQLSAENKTVPGAKSKDQPGVVTIPFEFYPLQDILFIVKAEKGKNLPILISNANGQVLGCDKGGGTDTDLLIVSTPYVAQKVGINVVNYGSRAVNFGLVAFLIQW